MGCVSSSHYGKCTSTFKEENVCNGPVVLPPPTLVSKPYGQDMCLLGQWQLAMLKRIATSERSTLID